MELIEILKTCKIMKSEIDELDGILKEKKSAFSKLESQASNLMLEAEIDCLTIAGIEYRQALPAFKITGQEADAFKWLSDNGYSEAIKQRKETINHQTLSKILRERLEIEGIESIPPELFSCVNTGKLKIKER